MKYKFCPQCTFPLDLNKGEVGSCPENTQYCPACNFVHWDNPIPVAAVLLPYYSAYDNLNQPPGGVLVVKRGLPPFVGGWCLPCGFMNKNERPKASARREVLEETGVKTRMKRLIALCNPSSSAGFELNQLTAFYLAKLDEDKPNPVAGDDATAVGIYYSSHKKVKNLTKSAYEHAELCFTSHNQIVKDYMNSEIARLGDDYELKTGEKS